MSSGPTTWPELRERFRARNEEEAHSLVTTAVERMKNRIPQSPLGRQFLGVEEMLSRLAILVGPESCRPILATQAPFYATAIEQAAQAGTPGASALIQLALLSYGNVARCIGDSFSFPFSSMDEQAMVERLIRGSSKLNEFEQEALAAACLAVGLPEQAIKVLEYGEPPPFKPGEKFDVNVGGCIHYLCAAMRSGAAEQDVQVAWEALHAKFPRILAAKVIKWSTLLCVGRVVLGRIGGRPDAEIAGAVHALSLRS